MLENKLHLKNSKYIKDLQELNSAIPNYSKYLLKDKEVNMEESFPIRFVEEEKDFDFSEKIYMNRSN